MTKPLFHSFYTDPNLSAVKHALLYYGEIAVPIDTFILIPDDKNDQNGFHYVQALNEQVSDDFDFLENEGVVELIESSHKYDLKELHQILATNSQQYSKTKTYSHSEVNPVGDFLNLDRNDQNYLTTINQITNQLAITCLSSILEYGYLPCVDNRIISDTIAIGMEGVIKQQYDDFDAYEQKRLRDKLFAQKVYSLFMPTFEFMSFHDVLELREQLSQRLTKLDQSLQYVSGEMIAMPWEETFQNEMNLAISKHVLPEVEALNQETKYSFQKVVKRISGAAAVYYLQTLMPKDLSEIVIGGGLVSVSNALISEQERINNALNHHGFGVLLEIKEL